MLEFKGLLCFSTNSLILQLTVYFTLHTFGIDFSLYGYFGLDRGTEFQLVPIFKQKLIDLIIFGLSAKCDFAYFVPAMFDSFV